MQPLNKIEAITANETANTVFQVLTIALVGFFSLAQAVNFLAAVII
jgi:hypothetical protein